MVRCTIAFSLLAALAASSLAQTSRLPQPPNFGAPKSALFSKLEAAYLKAGFRGTTSRNTKGGWEIKSSATVAGNPVEFAGLTTKADDTAIMTLRLKPIRDPKKLTKDNLLRSYIESQEFSPAYFSYDLDNRRFEVRMAIGPGDLTEKAVRTAYDKLVHMATLTRDLWDDTRWKER